MPKKKNHYVDSDVLEANWSKWLDDSTDKKSWDALLSDIYKICEGVAVHFNPKDEDEHRELAHETFATTIAKIESGKLRFSPGKAPVFNLLTTTIVHQLYSLKNKDSRRKRLYEKYKLKMIEERFPDVRCTLTPK